MKTALVTGSGGLVGSQAVEFFCGLGWNVIGLDNNYRKLFFGEGGDVSWNIERLKSLYPTYIHCEFDISSSEIDKLFRDFKNSMFSDVKCLIHCSAQPSHDCAVKDPKLDFNVNSYGTLNILEAYRKYFPDAVFIYTSTNKVYGDLHQVKVFEKETRWEPVENDYIKGIDENFPVDQSLHSLFGASKLSADIYCQEYGRYFNLPIGIFRGGCLTGRNHSGVKLHGFISYLIKCAVSGELYCINGYKGKQVRDNIHSIDLINAFYEFYSNPKCGEVYNIGGGSYSNISIVEAIEKIETVINKKMNISYSSSNRIGDHIWYISDVSKFQRDYPNWNYTFNMDDIIDDIVRKEWSQ